MTGSGLLVAGALLVVLAAPTPARAQERGVVEVSFDVGERDAQQGDWPVATVVVGGDLEVGEPFAVELHDASGDVLWEGETTFRGSPTRIEVATFVPVEALASVRVLQALTVVDVVVVPPEPSPEAPPEVEGEQQERPRLIPGRKVEVFREGAGPSGGGSGLLGVSMVLAVVVVAIVFRSPLPSASTQRWTR